MRAAKHISAGEKVPAAAPILISNRLKLADLSIPCSYDQITIFVDARSVCPFELELNAASIRAGGNQKIVFEPALAAVEH